MADLKIMLDQQETLDFDILIESNAANLSKDDIAVRFVVKDKGMQFVFETEKDGSTYTAKLPELKGILESGEKECILEVICNDRYFIPWESSIEFEEGIKIKADVTSQKETKETIVVEAKKRQVEEPEVVEEEKKVVPKKKMTEEQKKKLRRKKKLAEQKRRKEDKKYDEIMELHKQHSGRSLKDIM